MCIRDRLSTRGKDDAAIKAALVREMQRLGRAYPCLLYTSAHTHHSVGQPFAVLVGEGLPATFLEPTVELL